jgi:hypothetical protein
VQTLSAHYPAFAAIMSVPNAGDALAIYILDNRNPIRSRVAAFQVLSYVDRNKFKIVSTKLDDELSHVQSPNSDRLISYIREVESGTVTFQGMYPW